jgi:hypothetical protein
MKKSRQNEKTSILRFVETLIERCCCVGKLLERRAHLRNSVGPPLQPLHRIEASTQLRYPSLLSPRTFERHRPAVCRPLSYCGPSTKDMAGNLHRGCDGCHRLLVAAELGWLTILAYVLPASLERSYRGYVIEPAGRTLRFAPADGAPLRNGPPRSIVVKTDLQQSTVRQQRTDGRFPTHCGAVYTVPGHPGTAGIILPVRV